MPSVRRTCIALASLAGALLQACTGVIADEAHVAPGSLRLEPVVGLSDDTAAILAKPGQLSIDPQGRMVVTDGSDRNIKLYDAKGRRIATLGHAGKGPGEFIALSSAESFQDSILAYDFSGARFSVFGSDTRYVRSFELSRDITKPWTVRAVDDSLLLLIAPVLRAHDGNLLTLVRRDGSVVSTFFNKSRYFDGDRELIQQTGVVADARDGRVFAALVGGDSVYVFDYAGNRLAAHAADPEEPLVTVKTLLRQNGGEQRRPDGGWVVDGNRNVIRMVALDRHNVALQIVKYDAKQGVDPLEGGTVVTFTFDDAGKVAAIGRSQVRAGLLGRDRRGNALFVGYEGENADRYTVSRLVRIGATAQQEARR